MPDPVQVLVEGRHHAEVDADHQDHRRLEARVVQKSGTSVAAISSSDSRVGTTGFHGPSPAALCAV